MNTLRIPGFSAEASMYRTDANYRHALLPSIIGSSVTPALCFPDGCGPCRNGKQRCCENGHIIVEDCETPPPPPTCGPCVGVRHCSDGTQRSCSV
jgi:hypothetical protein